MIDGANIQRFAVNFFVFPDGYFEQHTAEELEVSEEERQELIRMQTEKNKPSVKKDDIDGLPADFYW